MVTSTETERKAGQPGFQPIKKEQSTLNQSEVDRILKSFRIKGLLEQVKIKHWDGKGEIKEVFRESIMIGYKLVAKVPTVMLRLTHENVYATGGWDGAYSKQKEDHSEDTKISDCTPAMGNIKTEFSIEVAKGSDAKFKLIIKDGPHTKDPGLIRPEPDRKCPSSVPVDFPLFEKSDSGNINQTSIFLNDQISAFKELKETLIKYFKSRSKTSNLPLQMKKMAEAFFVNTYHEKIPAILKDLDEEFAEWTHPTVKN